MNIENFINADLKNLVYDFKNNKKLNISTKIYSKMLGIIFVLLSILAIFAIMLEKTYKLKLEYKLILILMIILVAVIAFTIKQKRRLNSKESDKLFEIIQAEVLKNVFADIEKVNEKSMSKKMFREIFFRKVNTFKNSDTYAFKNNRKIKFHSAIFTTLINSDCSYYTTDYISQTYFDNKENKMEVFCKGIILEIGLNIDTQIKAYYQSKKNVLNIRKILKTTKESWKEKRIEAWNIDNKRKVNYNIDFSKDNTKNNLFMEEKKSNSCNENINEKFYVYSLSNNLEDRQFFDLYDRILKIEEQYKYAHDFAINGSKLYIYIPVKEFYNYTLFKSLDLVLDMNGMINKENRLYEKYSKFLEIANKQYKEILSIKNNYLQSLE